MTTARPSFTFGGVSEKDPGSASPTRFGVALTALTPSPGDNHPDDRLRARIDRFCTALGNALGVEVAPYVAADYRSLLEALMLRKVDFAWLPPVLALRAASEGRAIPIALPVRGQLASFHAALFSRTGSPVRQPADLRGVRAAWVDCNSASGYLVIRAALRAQGIQPDLAFSEERFYGSHEAVLRAVLSGEADVGATFSHNSSGPGLRRTGWGDHPVHVIARAGPIPADVIAAGIHHPVSRIRQVQHALTSNSLAESSAGLFEAEGLVAAESAHLRPLERLLQFLDDTAYRFTSQLPPSR